jgi:hypothetical protein
LLTCTTWSWLSAANHPGILVVRFDNDPRHNLTERAMATALGNLESSGVAVADRMHALNHWR